MAIRVLMPALSPTMTEGTVSRWLKSEGDNVKSGDVLAEIETDKATMEVEAVDEGVLGRILVPAGTANVKVNEPIAVLLEDGEDASVADKPSPAAAAPAVAKPATAEAVPHVNGKGHESQSSTPVSSTPVSSIPVSSTPEAQSGRVFASPLARRIAADAKLDLARISGTGPHGRIVKSDVDAAIGAGSAPAAKPGAASLTATVPGQVAKPSAPPSGAPSDPRTAPGLPPFELVPHSSMRKIIARRLSESKQFVPHFYLTIDCQLDALMKLRADLNAKAGEGGYKLSVNDFVIRAAALALKKMPTVNAAWSDDGTMMFSQVDISVAVAIPGGLITPIIHHADQKGLATISGEMKDLAARARSGKLKPEEFQGGTFSISNLGMFGIREFAAIINPPQSCILAVGAGEQRPVIKDGAIAVQTMMSCTLSTDHRVVDGALGAEYLGVFKKFVEDPLTMLL